METRKNGGGFRMGIGGCIVKMPVAEFDPGGGRGRGRGGNRGGGYMS
jgi:hypothetical protein